MTQRNWKVTGLTPENYVVLEVNGVREVTESYPSEYMCDYLTRVERGILRRGLTPSGRDRKRPKGD